MNFDWTIHVEHLSTRRRKRIDTLPPPGGLGTLPPPGGLGITESPIWAPTFFTFQNGNAAKALWIWKLEPSTGHVGSTFVGRRHAYPFVRLCTFRGPIHVRFLAKETKSILRLSSVCDDCVLFTGSCSLLFLWMHMLWKLCQARIQDFLQGGVNDGRVLRAPLASAPTGGLGLINIRLRYIASIEYSERFFLIFFFWLVKKFVEKQN